MLAFLLATTLAAVPAQPKKPEPKAQPRILLTLPLGVKPGAATRLTLRGLALDTATDVRCLPKGTVKILKKGKSAPPDKMDPNKVGDSTLEVELTVPADLPGGSVDLVADGPGGEGDKHTLLLDRTPILDEKEPNDGFRQAQVIALGSAISGKIGAPQDVDCFRFAGKAGQRVVIEIQAARLGSALDSFLALYDDRGQLLDSCDDIPGSADSLLEVTLPRDGAYNISVTDAHDAGGPLHVYRLSVKPK